MNSSIICRENKNTSATKALKRFYSVGDYVSSQKSSMNKEYLIKIVPGIQHYSENTYLELADPVNRLSFFKITCNYLTYTSEPNLLPFDLSLINVIQSIINKNNLENSTTNQNTSRANIEKYFSLQPSNRAQERKHYAADIKSTQDVFDVLDFGNIRNITDAYDSAVDILAESEENVLTNAIEVARKKYISDNSIDLAQSWEKNWEILIKAVGYALKIEPYKKMSLLLSLCDSRNKLSRLIKLTLIDTIVDLDIDTELIMVMLQIFISERELDNFVRNYAKEQAEECL